MWTFEPPLRHLQFVIEDVLDAPSSWRAIPGFEELDADTARAVLEQAGAFASGVLAPINAAGDLEGCRWRDGEVRTPAGYREAYRAFVEGGWPALACDPAHGGQGLPQLLNAALYEMLAAANHGWTMYPGLLHGAYECLKAHGSEALRERYLPKIVSGEWLATMCLTEPQAGSDLGRCSTRGVAQADGRMLVSGSKCFISGGEQDLTDNIVHLVLCRLQGDEAAGPAPAGSKGLSLVLCPKWLPDGSRNAIHCDGIEHKMGIHGSATCSMRFEGATGWLVGEPHRGLAAMFVMMNAARLHVGLQGLGHLEVATQNAWRHAAERVQMGRPIGAHPAMQRLLWRLRALAEGLRVIAMHTALRLDTAERHPDEALRRRAAAEVAVLTPVVKAFLTDQGFHGASQALQAFGGYGYVHETGIEQVVRDARIAMIYEGTNEIQAIDLLQRKLLDPAGGGPRALLDLLDGEASAARAETALAPFVAALQGQRSALAATLDALQQARLHDPLAPLAAADDVLHGVGHALLAWAWCRQARAALRQAGDPWHDDRLAAARFGLQWVLPQAQVHWQRAAAAHGLSLPACVA